MSSDAAFREALDEFEEAVFTADIDNPNSGWVGASRARVLALYAERQGEVATVSRVIPMERVGEYEITMQMRGSFMERTFGLMRPGDKVRVTKVEEGQ